jgi:hypothetical protein
MFWFILNTLYSNNDMAYLLRQANEYVWSETLKEYFYEANLKEEYPNVLPTCMLKKYLIMHTH